MAEMIDPSVALPSFQQALETGELVPRQASTDPHLFIAMDPVGSGVRLTYFRSEGGQITGICMVVHNGFHEGVVCFDLGYATAEAFRHQGRGSELVGAAVRDHISGMARAGVSSLYIEAVVGVENIGSQRIAERHLNPNREEITDSVSGLPAYRYVLPVGVDT